jgi:hypothetical protein
LIDIPKRDVKKATDDNVEQYPDLSIFDGRTAPYSIGTSDNPDTPYIPEPTTRPDPNVNWWDSEVSLIDGSFASERTETYVKAQAEFMKNVASGEITLMKPGSETDSLWKKKHDEQLNRGYVSSQSKVNRTYTGADMVPTVSIPGRTPVVIGDIMTMSISTHIEKFPARTCGRRNPLGFTTGQRTIAGSMIFALIDMYPWYKMMSETADTFWDQAAVFPLADMLPPFDITITLHNNYTERGAVMRLYGVTIVDDGMVFSIDDMMTENTYSYMAAGIAPVHYSTDWEVRKPKEIV